MANNAVLKITKTGFPWQTQDPFLFCVYHQDDYPQGNDELGPAVSLEGRNIGNDFIKKDGWRMYHGEKVPGFPGHPHCGFETITFVLKGLVDHADSNGAACRYGNGDVQWMTAGKGLQHSEMFPLLKKNERNPFELFQIWLNLPAKSKHVSPYYKMLWHDNLPKFSVKDENQLKTEIDLIAGKIGDTKAEAPAPDSWAADPENEVAIWHITMEANAKWEIPAASENVNRSLFYFEGDTIVMNDNVIEKDHAVELNAAGKVLIQNKNKTSRLLLLQGKPINEPVVQHGPFVMNNRAEIQEVIADFQRTEFGGWPWPHRDQVHDKTRGRFARFKSGEEIIK